jgi:hypothetical protein
MVAQRAGFTDNHPCAAGIEYRILLEANRPDARKNNKRREKAKKNEVRIKNL